MRQCDRRAIRLNGHLTFLDNIVTVPADVTTVVDYYGISLVLNPDHAAPLTDLTHIRIYTEYL